ncbi:MULTISPECIES: type 1 glutamine amidotransferase domain-containing protein [unclassified Streptomyces]|uniref:type 1 glutamine amidotransferase domain-containing protein n=1 Tax=unclassified Streptomyces TaxID=2593676 RepID=UPI002DDC40A6|nr:MULTISPECIES: type 1 glutamine amidotransferase domain-containing protein [unclassified Streptomyces]WSA95990.1 type 1 glutamine amidotransferase [Streptomyces sp. NBC_01795]WSB80406.1 type 1 glutamine amidotransferase [Streptomyces sp. NBC_01775]WSS11389.1 type 1 glutamine amidotransferase [Streptomyces sp. NBC_01186]WSS40095.1 type 1 glutamine amidotransferase [Streptomyces sp. NBC_01187]
MADKDLSGRRVLVIVTNYGVEQDELLVPVRHLREGGAEVDIAAAHAEPVKTLVGDKDPGETAEPTLTLSDADPGGYDLLLIPGGTLNADALRRNESAIDAVRSFTTSHRPVAAICHGAWALVEAGVVGGKTLTSYPSLQTDIRNAGGSWVDKSVVSDDAEEWVLVTSRTPDDLDDFLQEVDEALTGPGS